MPVCLITIPMMNSFKISDSETLEGQLDYIFGLTVRNMAIPKDETALNQFLCFKF